MESIEDYLSILLNHKIYTLLHSQRSESYVGTMFEGDTQPQTLGFFL